MYGKIGCNFEIPLSLFKKSLINDFLSTGTFTEEELNKLKKVSVAKWKFAANQISASSCNRSGKYRRVTYYYNLSDVAEYILNTEDLDTVYSKYINNLERDKEDTKNNYSYAIIRVQLWSKIKRKPVLVGEKTFEGIAMGNWLYYYKNNKIGKLKINSKKVIDFQEYIDFKTLRGFESINNGEDYFNKILSNILKEKELAI